MNSIEKILHKIDTTSIGELYDGILLNCFYPLDWKVLKSRSHCMVFKTRERLKGVTLGIDRENFIQLLHGKIYTLYSGVLAVGYIVDVKLAVIQNYTNHIVITPKRVDISRLRNRGEMQIAIPDFSVFALDRQVQMIANKNLNLLAPLFS